MHCFKFDVYVAIHKLLYYMEFRLAQVFSCEFCEISKNTFFTEHLWTADSSCSLL